MNSRCTHVVPVEAIRQGATVDGAQTLVKLVGQRAELEPNAIVELFENGWVATITYRLPGSPARVNHAHVRLSWAPVESVRAA
jgi:hypothetical protein